MSVLGPHAPRLWVYFRRYLFPYAALLGLAMLVLAGATAGIPFIAKRAIDDLVQLHRISRLHELSLVLAGLFLLRAFGNFANDYLSAYISQKLTLDLRSDLNEALQRKSLSFFNRNPSGQIVSRVLADVRMIVDNLGNGMFSLVSNSLSAIGLVATVFFMDWRLAVLGFVALPIAILPVTKFARRVRKESRNAQKQLGGLQSLLHETFQGNRVVKAFGMEDYERRRFNTEQRRLLRINLRVARIKAMTGPLIEAMGAFAVVAVVWYAVGSLATGARTLGSFAGFFGAMILVYQPIKRVSNYANTIQQGLAAADRVFEFMDEPTDVPDAADAVELASGARQVSFERVSFRYGEEWVLHDVSFRIDAGQVVALVGMSGGGKSTIADLIPRFYDVQDGRVAVDGVDVRKIQIASLRAQIGLVTQHTFLFNDTIRANIAYGSADKDLDRVIAAARAANAHEFIARLPDGYDTVVGELGVRLSGGERQRIAIARALLKDAPILILDEATSSLDSESERAVQEALEHLMQNRTTLVIAHRLSTVRRADLILVIVHGRIVEQGTHEELFARGREYRKLYDLQFASAEEANESLAN